MSPLDELRSFAAEADHASSLLERPVPDALDACATLLGAAAGRLAALQSSLPELAGNPDALTEAWRLRRTVRRAAALLSHAGDYHRQWQHLVAIRIAGYGPDGQPGEPARPGRLSLRG